MNNPRIRQVILHLLRNNSPPPSNYNIFIFVQIEFVSICELYRIYYKIRLSSMDKTKRNESNHQPQKHNTCISKKIRQKLVPTDHKQFDQMAV